MKERSEAFVGHFEPISLDELDQCARLLTRKDRKYIVDPAGLIRVLGALAPEVRALETAVGRWSAYESTYFDTPELDSFRMAATKRRGRFKVRTRCYVDSATTMIEVKTKDRRGRTVKHRQPVETGGGDVVDRVRRFAATIDEATPFVDDLAPRLTTSYQRATLVLPDAVARVTIDADYRAVDLTGGLTGLGDRLIVETKTNGAPSPVDRLLWGAGYRPVKFSKYATALAALHPELPHNRWHRVLVDHFDRTPPARRERATAVVDSLCPLPREGIEPLVVV